MRAEAELTIESIDRSVDRALNCLRQNYRAPGGGEAGWYHYLDDPHPGVTASAVGLGLFGRAGRQFEQSDKVIAYLLGQQVLDSSPAHGGWAMRTTHGFPVVEATAWVLRLMAGPGVDRIAVARSLCEGANWLAENQNTDFGWGSYRGQPSRVFHTALAMLALQECGGHPEVVANGQKWLIDAQDPHCPGWGALPGDRPTILHTAVSLLALEPLRGALGANGIRQTVDWLAERLEPESHFDEETCVEEYDLPFTNSGIPDIFQTSLAHFSGPVALKAMLTAGFSPLHPKVFRTVRSIVEAQLPDGTWKLPRSPMRPSIWAVNPFVDALLTVRSALVPLQKGRITLLYPGCAIVQSADVKRKLTTGLLLRNSLFDALRRNRRTVALWSIAGCYTMIACLLLVARRIPIGGFLSGMLLPVLALVFQIIWDIRSKQR